MPPISQAFALYSHPSEMEPLLPGEHRLPPLLEQAQELIRSAGRLAGMCPPGALLGLRGQLRAMHSYYSNKIEGEHASPAEIEQALRNDYASDADIARRQRLALAHMATETSIERQASQWDWATVWSPRTLQGIHQDLFARMPLDNRRSEQEEPVAPGELRTQQVGVGRHAAPDAVKLPDFLERWSRLYGGTHHGERRVLAAMASHQRLAWIHPFRDGNGRVARLHTHLLLAQLGLTNGIWSATRGFARSQDAYYAHLAEADEARAGDLDGRGSRTERGLENWISYALQLCLDEVQFMSGLLAVDGMKERLAACLAHEEQVVRQGVGSQALGALHHLFVTQSELDRSHFESILGLDDRLATTQIRALLKRGLLNSDSRDGPLRFGVPQQALRFYFPRLWPAAEAQ
ncbi:Fic family protein [Pseudorhodoferax soli]|uniref:Fic family protein n=1 Tax=Pseudorhodoferax soli TaxID=545864 RepID=A0A368XJI2_9BURK|nr:Fic family protein [Pseudorhodoferax soli]RCW68092.1 Fic family protein [Pseudorhodoferax soli]